MQEHALLCKILELTGTYDQLEQTNCSWSEAAARTIQTIEWAYHDKMRDHTQAKAGGRFDVEEVSAFAGTASAMENLCIDPSLLSYVKDVAEKDASILKKLRKAREEREARDKK